MASCRRCLGLGGVENTTEKKCFGESDRKALLKIIKLYVKPGSITHTDLWKAYFFENLRFSIYSH